MNRIGQPSKKTMIATKVGASCAAAAIMLGFTLAAATPAAAFGSRVVSTPCGTNYSFSSQNFGSVLVASSGQNPGGFCSGWVGAQVRVPAGQPIEPRVNASTFAISQSTNETALGGNHWRSPAVPEMWTT